MKPLIGLNLDYVKKDREYSKIYKEYYDYVSFNGGIPVLLPPVFEEDDINEIVRRVDGLIFVGGDDIHPSRYREKIKTKIVLTPRRREDFDFKLIEVAQRLKKPIFGICYGMQLLNIANKGTLFQDIAEKNPEHNIDITDRSDHKIMIKPGSFLHGIIGKNELKVNTYHHQAVNLLGSGLSVSAMAEDGLIEAIERVDNENFMLGVQWHPERMLEDEDQHKIIQAFISRCGGYQAERPHMSLNTNKNQRVVQFEIPEITVVK